MLVKLTHDEALPVHLAGSVKCQLDPEKFWLAWEPGAEVTTDMFAESRNLWAIASEPLDGLRSKYHVPLLDCAHAADGRVPSWYKPVS